MSVQKIKRGDGTTGCKVRWREGSRQPSRVWRHVRDRTLVVGAPKTNSRRTVQLLAPLRTDLAEWRLAQGRPGDREPVVPGERGPRSAEGFQQLAWARVCARVRAQGSSPLGHTTCATASPRCCCTRAAP
jgi:integrase